MRLFQIEQSATAYWADFALYAVAVAALVVYLALRSSRVEWPAIIFLVLTGLAAWTAIEYIVHRFILHGLPPFSHWHAQHHDRPAALICSPTLLSVSLLGLIVFLPALGWGGALRGSALSLGVIAGYLAYATIHHATHHWRADNAWLKQLKRWHAMHHHRDAPVCFGVSTTFWDHVFGTVPGGTRGFSPDTPPVSDRQSRMRSPPCRRRNASKK